MSALPEVFARPVTKSAATQCDSSRSVGVQLTPSHSEAKETQRTLRTALPLPSQALGREDKSPSSIVQLQSPQTGVESRTRLHSARYRHSPIGRQLTRAVQNPSGHFQRKEFPGKERRPYLQKHSKATRVLQPSAQQKTDCLNPLEGKPAPGKSVRLLPKANRSPGTTEDRVQNSQRETPTYFAHYYLGQATVPPQFALPSSYSQAFGPGLNDVGRRHEVLHVVAEFLRLPINATASYKVSQLRADYYVMTMGTLVPVSACCKASILVHLRRDGESEVACTAWQCSTRVLCVFELLGNCKERLWNTKNDPKVSVKPSKSAYSRPSRSTRLSSTPDPCLTHTPEPPVRSPDPPSHPKSPNLNPFNLKTSVTFQPPAHTHLSDSPIRRIFAKSRSRVRMSSLEELRNLWLSAVTS